MKPHPLVHDVIVERVPWQSFGLSDFASFPLQALQFVIYEVKNRSSVEVHNSLIFLDSEETFLGIFTTLSYDNVHCFY